MKPFIKIAAIAAAAGLVAAPALALEGAYQSLAGTTIVFADGVLHVTTADGVSYDDSYEIDGDTISVVTTSEEAACPGVTGVYTFAESDTGVTFTLVEDACEPRAADATSGEWVKVETDAAH